MDKIPFRGRIELTEVGRRKPLVKNFITNKVQDNAIVAVTNLLSTRDNKIERGVLMNISSKDGNILRNLIESITGTRIQEGTSRDYICNGINAKTHKGYIHYGNVDAPKSEPPHFMVDVYI